MRLPMSRDPRRITAGSRIPGNRGDTRGHRKDMTLAGAEFTRTLKKPRGDARTGLSHGSGPCDWFFGPRSPSHNGLTAKLTANFAN